MSFLDPQEHDRLVLQTPEEFYGYDPAEPHDTACRYCAQRQEACPCCWSTAWCPAIHSQVPLDERFTSSDCEYYTEAIRPRFDFDE